MQENLSALTLVQLREIAKEKGFQKITALRKSELIELIQGGKQQTASASENTKKTKQEEKTVIPEKKEAVQVEKAALPQENRAAQNIDSRKSFYENNPQKGYTSEEESGERAAADNAYRGQSGSNYTTPSGSNYSNQSRNNYGGQESGANTRTNNRRSVINRNNFTYNNRGANQQNHNNSGYNPNNNNSNYNNGSNQNGSNNYVNNGRNTQPLNEEQRGNLENGRIADGFFELISKEDENGNNKEFGFIRCDNYLSGTNDIYVGATQIRRFGMRTGDRVKGTVRSALEGSRWDALLYVQSINGEPPENARRRPYFEDLTPVFPDQRINLETEGCSNAIRIMNLFAPIGKGQRGMIVSPPKAGKTTLLKDVANAIIKNHPDIHIIILLIDERPEEVTDIKDTIEEKYDHVEVIYSTFDMPPEHHKNVAELVLERAKRMVESRQDVVILLDSITRLTRAYNLTVTPSGRTLSGGLDPAALNFPKKFFGAARKMREGGSLTILATALTDTGSRMDDVVFEEFKGTGNMEIVLDRKLSERRLFPAIDLAKSSTRRDDLLLSEKEQKVMDYLRKELSGMKSDDAVERIISYMNNTRDNTVFVERIKKLGLYNTTIVRSSSSGKRADEEN